MRSQRLGGLSGVTVVQKKQKKPMRRKPDFFVKQKDSSNKMQRRLLPESCSIFCPIE
jgi:hypothetical protein